jgi:hypothetical protein
MGVRIGGDTLHPVTNPADLEQEINIAIASQAQTPQPDADVTTPPPASPGAGSVQGMDKLSAQMKMNQALTNELVIKAQRAGLSDEDGQKLAKVLNNLSPSDYTRGTQLFEDALHSGNREAAMRAFIDLEPQRAAHPDRITPDLERSLVMGVGTARVDGALHGTKGGIGILGVDIADRAARTLVNMPAGEYKVIADALQNAGTGAGPQGSAQIERSLILKAVAARQGGLTDPKWEKTNAGKPGVHMSGTWEISHYADAIRGKDRQELVEKSTVQDLTTPEGTNALQQRFSTSCAPTSVQITEAEADPVKALSMHKEQIHSTSTRGDIGWEQKFILTFDGGVAVPRDLEDPSDSAKGISPDQVTKALNVSASPVTNRTYHRESVENTPKGRTAALDKMETQLRDQIDVPLVAYWDHGGAHALVATDVAGDKPNRQFLINDPWNGKTGWVSEKDIVNGHTDFFADKGHMGEIYPSVPKLEKVD